MKTPIAFFIFKRPETTLKVFEVIRQVKPQTLFVIADGSRSHQIDEQEKCRAARAIIEQVDWNCQVIKNYSEINLGCRNRVATGINWVFQQVEEAIILEDDCLPCLSFFTFCEKLLDYYRNDERIMSISGNNFQLGKRVTIDSYYFSYYPHIWGWATWRRAWNYYDQEMKEWPKIRDSPQLNLILEDARSVKYWTEIFQKVYDNLIDTWDYQWTFSSWLHQGLHILPVSNLVSNIGFNNQGSHTTETHSPWGNLPTEEMTFPLHHPPQIIRHKQADQVTQNTVFDPTLSWRIKKGLKKLRNLL